MIQIDDFAFVRGLLNLGRGCVLKTVHHRGCLRSGFSNRGSHVVIVGCKTPSVSARRCVEPRSECS